MDAQGSLRETILLTYDLGVMLGIATLIEDLKPMLERLQDIAKENKELREKMEQFQKPMPRMEDLSYIR